MKKFLVFTLMIIGMTSFPVYATEIENSGDSTNIPIMSIEEFAMMMQAKQGKVDIIKKNNIEITELKESLKIEILEAAKKVNNLRIDISADKIEIDDETILELKELLEFLQDAKTTLEIDAEKISNEIEEILDLISTKGMQLEQYDLLIEKQNTVIVKMKEILETVNKI
ncbi:MAG: hypothetical protein IJX99_03690 [Clostridia bacterium]|nr:hypothetical protein [Clostridia bacterium]